MNTIRLLVLAILATLVTSLHAVAAGDPSGTWKFTVQSPNGGSIESTLTLRWENNRLSGSVTGRAGEAEITDAAFADDRVSFSVVRKIGRGFRKKKFTINYTGKLEGDAITGTIETTGRDKKPVSIPWNAQRGR